MRVEAVQNMESFGNLVGLSLLLIFVKGIQGHTMDQNRSVIFPVKNFGADLFSHDVNESQVYDMITLFSTRFGELTTKYHSSLTHIVIKAVATHNQLLRKSTSNFIRVHIIVGHAELFNSTNSFSLMEAALAGNEITPVMAERLIDRNVSLQIGLKVHQEFCEVQDPTFILNSIGHMYILLVDIHWTERYHLIGVENSILEIQATMRKCQSNIPESHRHIPIGFYIRWPDTNCLGTRRNQSELVKFWKAMILAVEKHDVKIFMDQAFDSVNPDTRDIFNSNGWWTKDWKEKAVGPEDIQLIPISSILSRGGVCQIDSLLTGIAYDPANHNVNNRFTNTRVVFNQSFLDNPLSRDDILPYLTIISERFSKLVYFITSNNLDPRSGSGMAQFQVLEAFAVWNKARAECTDEETRFLDVSVAMNLDLNDTYTSDQCMESLIVTSALINKIGNQTIKRIMVVLDMPEAVQAEVWEAARRVLVKYQKMAHMEGVELAVIESAAKFNKPGFLTTWVTYMPLSVKSTYLQYDICFSAVLSSVISVQRNIANALQKRRSSIELGLYLNLLQPDCEDFITNHSHTAALWVALDEFGRMENVQILLGPVIARIGKPAGEWFKQSKNGSNTILSEGVPLLTVKQDISVILVTSLLSSSLPVGIIIGLFLCTLLIGSWLKIRKSRLQQHKLYEKEAADFRQATQIPNAYSNRGSAQPIICVTYDMNLEVGSKNYTIEKDGSLGSGAYGCVTLAKISKNGITLWVAAKTLKYIDHRNPSALRNLLMEIKICSYLGHHPNITQLLGAYTREVSSGKVFAFYELCHLGSLHNFLRGITQFNSTDAHLESDYMRSPVFEVPRNEMLSKWSVEIANGMEYIASKYIIHGDLATRNVLLDKEGVAKICDFGLSRRMENYENYVKQNQEPLPWRWMAYESLTGLQFSSKSDVWSYGVTVWEIFSEGEVPYPGLQWTPEFVGHLKRGMRLPKPQDASEKMYELMQTCWETSPDCRPGFQEIKHRLDLIFTGITNETNV